MQQRQEKRSPHSQVAILIDLSRSTQGIILGKVKCRREAIHLKLLADDNVSKSIVEGIKAVVE